MKKVSLQNGLLSLILILIIVLVVLYIKYLKVKSSNNKPLENFYSGNNKITIKNNFYETSNNSPLFKSSSRQNLGYKVGGVNLCVYTSDNTKVTDIECISSGVFNNALALPKARRETVCIDEECIDLKDVKFLLGETDFQLKTRKSSRPTQKNYKNSLCLGRKYVPIHSCSGHNYSSNNGGNDFIGAFGEMGCYDGNSRNNDTIFNINPRLGMSFDELQRLGIDEITPPVTGSGTGGSGVVVDPQHP